MKDNRIIPDVIKSLTKKKTIIVRSPKSTRPWQHVLDPLFGYLKLGSKLIKKDLVNIKNPSWNFGPHKSNSVEVLKIVKNIIKLWSKKNYKIKIMKNQKFKETHLLSLKIQKAYKELRWKPKLTLNENLQLTIEWYKSYYKKSNMVELTKKQINYYLNK